MSRYGSVLITFLILLRQPLPVAADGADYSKMSSYVRSIAMTVKADGRRTPQQPDNRLMSAFVRLSGNADSVLAAHGCRSLARFGDIHIAAIPVGALRGMSLSPHVLRIESGRSCSLTVDVAAQAVGALSVYEGRALPQAYTGSGVVMGIMDVGFDLTHPNFYDAAAENYRIRRLWDQLSVDTVGSSLFVGAEYTTTDELLAYAHSRDGLKQTHGTHTLGIAAGGGYDSPYRGLAYGSDICLVSNAVTSDLEFIDENDIYKYTYATDALGFKYIFDYAAVQGKPCVISFSEGSHQDFRGDDLLFYEVLGELTGPGRILVASAGNEGHLKTYIDKPAGRASAGSMLIADNNRICFTVTSDRPCGVRIVCYGGTANDTLTIHPAEVMAREDKELAATVTMAGRSCALDAAAYVSCYDENETACDISVYGLSATLAGLAFSVELTGNDADAQLYMSTGYLYDSSDRPHLCDAVQTHNILSPSSAPSVICVSSTVYRASFTNYLGETFVRDIDEPGERVVFSSVGPTYDRRIKPDVMAPGSNVISSYSSYYLEANPEASDIANDVAHFGFNGRTYAWNSNSGTSMASPVVGGTVALWLEARPELTPSDVLGVIERTSRRLDDVQPVPNNLWGYGEIDAYRGLLDLLGLSGVEGLADVMSPLVSIMPVAGGRLRLSFGCTPSVPLTLQVYGVGGELVGRCTVDGGTVETTVDAGMSPGSVYAVRLSASDSRFCGSTLVRAVR